MSTSTQSPFGRVVLTLFLLPILAVTALMVFSPFVQVARAAWTYAWTPVPATILESRMVEDGGGYLHHLRFRYEAAGETRSGELRALGDDEPISNPRAIEERVATWSEGTSTTCFVSPLDADEAVLQRGDPSLDPVDLLITFLVGALFFVPLAASFYVIHWGLRIFHLVQDPRTFGRGVVLTLSLAVLAMGAVFFLQFVWRPASLVLDARGWEPARCEILRSEVVASEETIRVEAYGASRAHDTKQTLYDVDLEYTVRVAGEEHPGDRYRFFPHSAGEEENRAIADLFPVGSEVDCWVDPDDPSASVLDRGFGREILWAAVPLFMLAVGLALFVFFLRFPVGREAGSDPPREGGRP